MEIQLNFYSISNILIIELNEMFRFVLSPKMGDYILKCQKAYKMTPLY